MRKEDLQEWVVPAAVGAISFAAGVAVGYFIHKRKWDYRYVPSEDDGVEFAELEEYAQAPLPFEAQIVDAPPIIIVNDESELPPGVHTIVVEETEDELHFTIFDEPPEPTADWDYSYEVPLRTDDAPYIIHRDEFITNEEDNTQLTITFYEGDQVVCDEEDIPMYDHEKMLGPLLFGKGSEDPSIVYIRNPIVGTEYGVIRDRGFYQVEVLGAQIESQMAKDDLRHSKSPRRMRPE